MSDARVRLLVAIVLLGLSATSGSLDAFAFIQDQVFVANQTGNLVVVALDVAGVGFAGAVGASLVALGGFILGTVSSIALRRSRVGGIRSRHILLLVEPLILLVTIGLVALGVRGYWLIAVLAVSQGVQGVIFTRLIGQGFRTVAITGSMVDVARMGSVGAWGKASLAACPPIGYGIGTVSGALVDQHIGEIWCLVLATLFCLGSAACIRELELAGVDVH